MEVLILSAPIRFTSNACSGVADNTARSPHFNADHGAMTNRPSISAIARLEMSRSGVKRSTGQAPWHMAPRARGLRVA